MSNLDLILISASLLGAISVAMRITWVLAQNSAHRSFNGLACIADESRAAIVKRLGLISAELWRLADHHRGAGVEMHLRRPALEVGELHDELLNIRDRDLDIANDHFLFDRATRARCVVCGRRTSDAFAPPRQWKGQPRWFQRDFACPSGGFRCLNCGSVHFRFIDERVPEGAVPIDFSEIIVPAPEAASKEE